VLWYPTQAKTGLEWGTQPSLPVKQASHPACPLACDKLREKLHCKNHDGCEARRAGRQNFSPARKGWDTVTQHPGAPEARHQTRAPLPPVSLGGDDQLSPATKAGCPIQAVLWLEWDTTALDAPLCSFHALTSTHPPRSAQWLFRRRDTRGRGRPAEPGRHSALRVGGR
jgi:hypothetical protein